MDTLLKDILKAKFHEPVFKRDGTVQIKRGYFYRPKPFQDWIVSVQNVFIEAGYEPIIVKAEDHWNSWPRDSFFEVIINPVYKR